MTLTATKPDDQVTPADVAQHNTAVEAALRSLREDARARLAAIPAELSKRLAKAARGNPAKRAEAEAGAVKWADDTHILVVQGLADREAELLTGLRAFELGALEARRGGRVVMVTRDIETPILKDGAQVWRRGRRQTKREVISRPHVTARDGLETLATAHLKANGEPIMMRDGKTPMVGLFNAGQLAALHRYRAGYLETRETSLPAVDATGAGEDRTPFNIQRSMTLERMVSDALAAKEDDKRGRSIRKLEGHVSRLAGREALMVLRAVAGEGHTIRSLAPGRRRAIRLTRALIKAADVLADRMGLQ